MSFLSHKNMLSYFSLGFLIIALDRISKSWILDNIEGYHTVTSFFSLTRIFNRGVSWSMLHSTSDVQFYLVTCLAMVIFTGLLVYTVTRIKAGFTIFGETCALAGAFSNIIDRFLYGGVLDFIVLHYRDWLWPVFNIADAFIVGGVFLMILNVYHEK